MNHYIALPLIVVSYATTVLAVVVIRLYFCGGGAFAQSTITLGTPVEETPIATVVQIVQIVAEIEAREDCVVSC
mgnify:CR=1 FL=1